MTANDSLTRRTVIGTLASLLAAVFGVSAGTAHETTAESPQAEQPQTASDTGVAATQRALLTGIYDGTIDRIVDGEHVVILLESDGETVGQKVLDHDRVPAGEEGDSVTVWLFRGSVLAVQVH